MCGVAFYHFSSPGKLCAGFKRDLAEMKFRGPDNQQLLYLGKNIALGHTRLAINGLSEEFNQPYTEDQENFLIFNGEIYSFREEDENQRSDTKFLYQHLCRRKFSIDLVADFLCGIDGVWSFIFVTKDIIYVSRDIFGEKPLYVHRGTKDHFISVSSIEKSFCDQEVVTTEFAQNSIAAFSRNDFQLLSEKKIIKFNIKKTEIEFYQFASHFRKLITASVQRRINCDVDIACTVSGGLDSSLIAAIVCHEARVHCRFYTTKFTEHDGEIEFINYLERKLGIAIVRCELTVPDYFDHLAKIYSDFPSNILSPSSIAHSLLMERISKDGFKVCLDGQGADEYLGGYHYQFVEQSVGKFLKKKTLFNAVQIFSLLKSIGSLAMVRFAVRNIFRRRFSSDLQILINSLTKSPLPSLLSYTDYVSMRNSVEVRTPYLDINTVLYSLSHNPTLINPKSSKSVLRKLLSDYDLDKIASRTDKMGYELPWSAISIFLRSKDGQKYMPVFRPLCWKSRKNSLHYFLFRFFLLFSPKQAIYIYFKLVKNVGLKFERPNSERV